MTTTLGNLVETEPKSTPKLTVELAFRQLIELSPFGVYVVDADFCVRYVSEGAQKAFENVRPLIGRNFCEVMHILWPDEFANHAINVFRHTLATGEPHHEPSTVEQRSDTGTIDAYDWKAERIEMPDGRFGVICHFYDLSDRQRREEELLESQSMLRKVMDHSIAFIGILGTDGTLLEANASALLVGGLHRDQVVGKSFWDTFWWNHDEAVVNRLKQAFADAMSGETVRYDEVVRIENDGRLSIEFMMSPIINDDGTISRLVVSGFDITGRIEAAQRVELLVRELNHRSRNVLTLVQAMARQTARSSPEDFIRRFEERLLALATAQDSVLNSKNGVADLDSLIKSQLGHFDDLIGSRIHVAGPPVIIQAEAAQTIGLALHELATNASKYGALSNEAGRINISWSIQDGQVALAWEESGGPLVTAPTRKGFGSVVIDAMARTSLKGTVALDFAATGLTWRLIFPQPNA